MKSRFFAAAIVSLLVAGPLAASGWQQQSWTGRYQLAADGQVAVTNLQGSIEVEGWDCAEVELTVIKTAPAQGSVAGARVAIEREENVLRVRTLYAPDADTPVEVDYRLRVPRQARLEALRTVNGSIRVRDVEGPVQAHTLNGDIVETGAASSVLAQAVNGSVRVALRTLPEPGGRLELETINGDLLLVLPAEAHADLELSTVAGRIETGLLYPAAASEEGTVRARVGRGGLPVRLRTVRGSIRVVSAEEML